MPVRKAVPLTAACLLAALLAGPAPAALAQPAGPAAADAGGAARQNEEKLYRLFETHLQGINTILTIFGIVLAVLAGGFTLVQVMLQYQEGRRQRKAEAAEQKRREQAEKEEQRRQQDAEARARAAEVAFGNYLARTTGLMENSSNLITSMRQIIDINSTTLGYVKALEEREKHERAEREGAVRALNHELAAFAHAHDRYDPVEREFEAMAARVQETVLRHNVPAAALAPEADLVLGLHATLFGMNNKKAIDHFERVLASGPAADNQSLRQAARLNLGHSLLFLKQNRRAAEVFVEAAREDPANALYDFLRIKAQLLELRSHKHRLTEAEYRQGAAAVGDRFGRLWGEQLGAGMRSDPMPAGAFRADVAYWYASFLIYEDGRGEGLAAAAGILREPGLEGNSAVEALRFRVRLAQKQVAPGTPEYAAALEQLIEACDLDLEHNEDPRERLTVGMRRARFHLRLGKRERFEKGKKGLLYQIDNLRRKIPPEEAVYSVITNNYETLAEIRQQIESDRMAL